MVIELFKQNFFLCLTEIVSMLAIYFMISSKDYFCMVRTQLYWVSLVDVTFILVRTQLVVQLYRVSLIDVTLDLVRTQLYSCIKCLVDITFFLVSMQLVVQLYRVSLVDVTLILVRTQLYSCINCLLLISFSAWQGCSSTDCVESMPVMLLRAYAV